MGRIILRGRFRGRTGRLNRGCRWLNRGGRTDSRRKEGKTRPDVLSLDGPLRTEICLSARSSSAWQGHSTLESRPVSLKSGPETDDDERREVGTIYGWIGLEGSHGRTMYSSDLGICTTIPWLQDSFWGTLRLSDSKPNVPGPSMVCSGGS